MTSEHDKPRRSRGVSEPVQVYLAPSEQARLNRLTAQLATSKSEIIRRGLEALEQQLTDPASHPALQLIGLVEDVRPGAEWLDVARDHDRFLAESEASSWGERPGAGSEKEAVKDDEPGDSNIATRDG